jgi:hypothetical protein
VHVADCGIVLEEPFVVRESRRVVHAHIIDFVNDTVK